MAGASSSVYQREVALKRARAGNKVYALSWFSIDVQVAAWQRLCSQAFLGLMCCAFCGFTALGGLDEKLVAIDPLTILVKRIQTRG